MKFTGQKKTNIPSGVSNPEATRLDSTDSGRANDEDALLLGLPENFTSMTLGNTFGDEGEGLDLREFKALEGARVDTSGAGKVDNDINFRVLGASLLEGGVNREKSLLGSPVELLDVVSAEGVDHGGDGGCRASAGVIEVKHALDGTGLEAVDERAGRGIEWPVCWARGGSTLGVKMYEVVGRLGAFAIGVDGTNSVSWLASRGNLRRRGIGLDRVKTADSNVAGFVLGNVDAKSQRNNLGDVGVGTKDTDGNAQALSEETHGFETLLVVGSSTSDEDLDLVGNQLVLELLESTDDALEGGGDIGEVGNTSSNDEDLSFGVGGTTSDEVDYKESN